MLIFVVLSTHLSKADFGQLNWVLAVLLVVYNVLTFGLDQIVVQQVAGDKQSDVPAIFLKHLLVTGSGMAVVLLLLYFGSQSTNETIKVLLIIGIGKLFIYWSGVFKQVAAGLEKFRALAAMSVVSNIVKTIALCGLTIGHQLSFHATLITFLISDGAELLMSAILYYSSIKLPLKISHIKESYPALLRKSLPQTGVVFLSAALSRTDWILIGFFLTSAKVAEYSFAYKIFEMATLPLLAFAPLLLPRFTRVLKQSQRLPASYQTLLNIEIVLAVFSGLLLYLLWTPCIDLLTSGRYGAGNLPVVTAFCFCLPLMYINNFYWSTLFAKGLQKPIFRVFLATFAANLIGNLVLIPLFGNAGAAYAYLLAMAVQAVLYMALPQIDEVSNTIFTLLKCLLFAIVSAASASIIGNAAYAAPLAALIFMILVMASGTLKLGLVREITRLSPVKIS